MMDYMIYSKVNREELLEVLRGNRERYVNSIDALKAAWNETNEFYQKLYAEWSAKYVAGTLAKDETKPQPPPKIVDRKEDYDLYIDLFSVSAETYVDLEQNDFNRIWRDNWNWMKTHKDHLLGSTSNAWNNLYSYGDGKDYAYSDGTALMLSASVEAYGLNS